MILSYTYPDKEDSILDSFIREQEPYPGYWDASEERALARLSERLVRLLPAREAVSALDAGCGEGRALPWIAGFAEKITAMDPDLSRLSKAVTQTVSPKTHLHFENGLIGDAGGGPYQLIVCNHVVEHVSTSMTREIIFKFRDLATPDTILVMSFTRSPIGKESYGIAHMKAGVADFELIDRERFNRLADAGGPPGYLPVRLIDPTSFAAEALAAGWTTRWSWTYHLMGQSELEPGKDHDELVNRSPSLVNRSGGDIYVVMRPVR